MILNGISAVSLETGINPSSLRRWESMGLIEVSRLDFGETWVRIFTDEDVEFLKAVKRLMNEGMKLRPAFAKAREELNMEALSYD